MYTIFKNETSVILSVSDDIFVPGDTMAWSKENLDRVIRALENNENGSFVLVGKNLDIMWQDFKKEFKVVEAAGGVVRDDQGKVLLIFRNETWDLPKGKIDPGESPEGAAIREVREECGFTSLKLMEPIQNTYHVYEEKGKHILKVTYWYSMHSQQRLLKPQQEEGITDLSWKSLDEMEPVFANTYPNIKLLISGLKN